MDTSLETCVDTDSSGDDCTFTPGDSSSCGAGCDYTPPKRTDSGGNVLTLHLVAYTSRPGLPIMQPVIASALTALGITVTSTTTDNWGDHDAIMAARSWDLLSEYSNGLSPCLPQPLVIRPSDADHCYIFSVGAEHTSSRRPAVVPQSLLQE